MATCVCGCGTPVKGHPRKGPRLYVRGHNLRNLKRTAAHRANIAAGQRRAWSSKRQRLPIGSTNIDSDGYVRVKVVEGKGRWMPQHHLVMAEAIGRPLRPGEVVHHINGVRHDNDPANLFLCRDQRHHQEIESSLAAAHRELLAAGLVRFNRGTARYEAVLRGRR